MVGRIRMKRKKPKRKLRVASIQKNHIPYSKYRIEWFDIASDSGWATDKEFSRMKLATPVSEGWLYEKNECVLKIFASYDKDEEGIVFGERTIIPLSCVKKMKKLNELSEKFLYYLFCLIGFLLTLYLLSVIPR